MSEGEIPQSPSSEAIPFDNALDDTTLIETIVPIVEESINQAPFRTKDVISICNKVYRYISKPYDALKIGPFKIVGMESPHLYHIESTDAFKFIASICHSFIHHYHNHVP